MPLFQTTGGEKIAVGSKSGFDIAVHIHEMPTEPFWFKQRICNAAGDNYQNHIFRHPGRTGKYTVQLTVDIDGCDDVCVSLLERLRDLVSELQS